MIVAAGCSGDSEIYQKSKDIDTIQQSIDKNGEFFIKDSTVNSVSIGIFKDGKTYIGHYGELNPNKGNRPTDNTIYEIASVSKTFVGTIVAQAELDGKINIEDNIQKYLKEDYPNLKYEGNPIKIKHLLTHTSGLPKFLPISVNLLFNKIDESLPFKYTEIEEQYNKQEFLADLHDLVLDTIPGARFEYSNIGTELIAHILENIYDKNYEELVQQYIYNIADMPNTKMNLTENEKNKLAYGYFGKQNKQVPPLVNNLWGGAGAIKSTVPDMINYMKFQLDEKNLIVKKSHKVLYQEEGLNVAYFWFTETDEKDGTAYIHDGTTFGVENWVFLYPKHNLGIYIVSNHIDEDTEDKIINTANGILDDIRLNIK